MLKFKKKGRRIGRCYVCRNKKELLKFEKDFFCEDCLERVLLSRAAIKKDDFLRKATFPIKGKKTIDMLNLSYTMRST